MISQSPTTLAIAGKLALNLEKRRRSMPVKDKAILAGSEANDSEGRYFLYGSSATLAYKYLSRSSAAVLEDPAFTPNLVELVGQGLAPTLFLRLKAAVTFDEVPLVVG